MKGQQAKPNCNAIIRDNLPRCQTLYESGIFNLRNGNDNFNLLRESAFTELLIRLNDILQCLDKNSKRINCSEHIQTDNGIKDITDLINKLRNAACHVTSGNRKIQRTNIEFSFNIVQGNSNALRIGNTSYGCEFEDDTAYFYGNLKIYLHRHIERLLQYLEKMPSL